MNLKEALSLPVLWVVTNDAVRHAKIVGPNEDDYYGNELFVIWTDNGRVATVKAYDCFETEATAKEKALEDARNQVDSFSKHLIKATKRVQELTGESDDLQIILSIAEGNVAFVRSEIDVVSDAKADKFLANVDAIVTRKSVMSAAAESLSQEADRCERRKGDQLWAEEVIGDINELLVIARPLIGEPSSVNQHAFARGDDMIQRCVKCGKPLFSVTMLKLPCGDPQFADDLRTNTETAVDPRN